MASIRKRSGRYQAQVRMDPSQGLQVFLQGQRRAHWRLAFCVSALG